MTEPGERVAVVGSVVDGLKSSPLLLAMICLCAIVFGLTAWSVQKSQDRTNQLMERLMDRCLMGPIKNTRWPLTASQKGEHHAR